ncbi:DUF1833 family protein [Castellaniella sp.]|uniref:DUF1833 family protein n=1 Tax=Castellaniella sp. TaxID=1955812 RepID=UPI002AFF4981|nr:DUF1833 family protein [Castellaniella sp.]
MADHPAWAEAEACCNPAVSVLYTLEFLHPAFLQDGATIPLRFVLDVEARMLGIEAGAQFGGGQMAEFLPLAFEADMPTFGEGQIPECKIRIDNAAGKLTPYLEEAVKVRADFKVIYRQYREDDISEPVDGPTEFLITKVTVSGTVIEGVASFTDLVNMKFPGLVYTRKEFTSLSYS